MQVPQVWQRILSLSEGENAIAGAPCQSSLINILPLLIEKTGDQCLSTPPLREVIFQLIGFCVNLGSDRASYLLEDGLKLWRCVMLHGSWQADPEVRTFGAPKGDGLGDQTGAENEVGSKKGYVQQILETQ